MLRNAYFHATKIAFIFAIISIDILTIIAYNKDADRNILYTRVTEFTFKRHVMSSATRPPVWVVFLPKVQEIVVPRLWR